MSCRERVLCRFDRGSAREGEKSIPVRPRLESATGDTGQPVRPPAARPTVRGKYRHELRKRKVIRSNI